MQCNMEVEDEGKGRGGEKRWSLANPCSVSVTWLIAINFPGIDGLPGPELHSLLHFAWYVLCVPWRDAHSTTSTTPPPLPLALPPAVLRYPALRNINSWVTNFWRRAINRRKKTHKCFHFSFPEWVKIWVSAVFFPYWLAVSLIRVKVWVVLLQQ